jgi:uncharacterized membrane protein
VVIVESRAKILGHPIHPMLVVFPLGLFFTAVIFDFIDLVGGPGVLGDVAYWNIAVGLIGGILAAFAGLRDLRAIPGGTRAKRIALRHGTTNASLLALFAISWLIRMGGEYRSVGGGLFVLELVAVGLASLGAWLGGELVDRLGVGVSQEASLDASSSLRQRPATR